MGWGQYMELVLIGTAKTTYYEKDSSFFHCSIILFQCAFPRE